MISLLLYLVSIATALILLVRKSRISKSFISFSFPSISTLAGVCVDILEHALCQRCCVLVFVRFANLPNILLLKIALVLLNVDPMRLFGYLRTL